MARRLGRGPLSTIDRLPDWAGPAVIDANEALKGNKLTQIEIHEAFNAQLRALAFAEGIVSDVPQISRSAFNRRSMRLATIGRRLAETREITAVLASRLEDGGDEHLTLTLAETIKTIVFEALENAGSIAASPMAAEMMANFALALKSAEQTKAVATKTRQAIQETIAVKVPDAVDQMVREKGLSKETGDQIKRMVLGLADAR
jgi:hypothetical protein